MWICGVISAGFSRNAKLVVCVGTAVLLGPIIFAAAQTAALPSEQLAVVKFRPDQIDQIIQDFEQLPPGPQSIWLDKNWPQVSDLRWLPLLKKLAARPVVFRQGNDPADFDPVVSITKLALKRWYELDPATGREAILQEITRPAPRFGEDVLGILPDLRLPLEQRVIAQNLLH
jgi:hypothetical protein